MGQESQLTWWPAQLHYSAHHLCQHQCLKHHPSSKLPSTAAAGTEKEWLDQSSWNPCSSCIFLKWRGYNQTQRKWSINIKLCLGWENIRWVSCCQDMIYFNIEVSTWSTSNLFKLLKSASYLSGGFVGGRGLGVFFSAISKKATGLTSTQDNDAYTGSDVLEHLSSWEFFFLFIHNRLFPCQAHQPSLLPSPVAEWESCDS